MPVPFLFPSPAPLHGSVLCPFTAVYGPEEEQTRSAQSKALLWKCSTVHAGCHDDHHVHVTQMLCQGTGAKDHETEKSYGAKIVNELQ